MIQLTEDDVGFVNAVVVLDTTKGTMLALRTFVLLFYRPASKLKVYELKGDALEHVQDLEGVKHSGACLLAGDGELRVLAGTRIVDVAGAPCPLHLHTIPLPGIFPLDYGAVRRLWSETGAIVGALDGLTARLRPYAK